MDAGDEATPSSLEAYPGTGAADLGDETAGWEDVERLTGGSGVDAADEPQ